MPPKGNDTPPASPLRNQVLVDLSPPRFSSIAPLPLTGNGGGGVPVAGVAHGEEMISSPLSSQPMSTDSEPEVVGERRTADDDGDSKIAAQAVSASRAIPQQLRRDSLDGSVPSYDSMVTDEAEAEGLGLQESSTRYLPPLPSKKLLPTLPRLQPQILPSQHGPSSSSPRTPRRSSLKKVRSAIQVVSSETKIVTSDGRRKHTRAVSFNSLEFRKYSQVLGDHPCCSAGPPISLGWDYDPEHTTVEVEEYESSRVPRRTRRDMRLACEERREILSSVVQPPSSDDGDAADGQKLPAYTPGDFRRAERRLYRERRVSSRAMNGFFSAPAGGMSEDDVLLGVSGERVSPHHE